MADARNTQQFVEQVESAETPSIRSTQQFAEQVESAETPSIRITQLFVENLIEPPRDAAVTQIAIEESQSEPRPAVTQIAIEYSRQTPVALAVSQLALEISVPFFLPGVSITPAPAEAVCDGVDPQVALILYVATAVADADDPQVILSSVSITPAPAEAEAVAINPTTYHGWIIYPTAAEAIAEGSDPALVGKFITIRRYVMRVTEQDYGLPGILKNRCEQENPRLYPKDDPASVGAGGGAPGGSGLGGTPGNEPGGTIPEIGLSGVYLMDVPIFRDLESDASYYAGAFPQTGDPDAWRGATLLVSPDKENWTPLLNFGAASSVAGVTESTLPNVAQPGQWDLTSTLQVKLFYGELSNITPLQALNDILNTAVVGSEIIKFTTATPLGNNRWRLSGFIRARRGSAWATAHSANERFILLDPTTIQRPEFAASDLNQMRYYQIQSVSGVVEAANIFQFTNTGIGLKPYSPCFARGSRDGSNNLTVDFFRRSRLRGSWNLVTDPPLGEESESYEADIYDAGFTIIERTLTSTTTQFSYSYVLQTIDGYTPGDLISMKIYQISATVGRGFPLQVRV